MNITWKELYVIIIAVHTWGVSWQHQKILFNCDNLTVVNIWAKVAPNLLKSWPWYGYYSIVLHVMYRRSGNFIVHKVKFRRDLIS